MEHHDYNAEQETRLNPAGVMAAAVLLVIALLMVGFVLWAVS